MSVVKKKPAPKFIFCVAGKSAGHIIPGIMYIEKHFKNHKLVLCTTKTEVDYKAVDSIKSQLKLLRHYAFNFTNFPGKKLWLYPLFIIQFIAIFFRNFYLLLVYRPEKIISTGGYISLPVCIAGWVLRVPIELFELNVIPGRAAHALAPFCSEIKVCFKDAKAYFPSFKTKFESYPIRFNSIGFNQNISTGALTNIGLNSKESFFKKHNFDVQYPTVLILGGSQGSEFINNVAVSLAQHSENLFNIIHQVGPGRLQQYSHIYKKSHSRVVVFEYADDLRDYYLQADYVIARAGAGTIFELAYFNKKSFIIPLAYAAQNHQLKNAYAIQAMYPHLFTVIEQKSVEYNTQKLLDSLKTFF